MILFLSVFFVRNFFYVFLVNPIASQYHAQVPHQPQPQENFSLHYESYNQVNFSPTNYPQSNQYHQPQTPLPQNHQNQNFNPMQNVQQQTLYHQQQQIIAPTNLINQDPVQQHHQFQQPNANQFIDNSGQSMNAANASFHQQQQDLNSMMLASTSGTNLQQQNLYGSQQGQVRIDSIIKINFLTFSFQK